MGDGYQLIVGERRWRAAKLAGIEQSSGDRSRGHRCREPRAGARRESAPRRPESDGGGRGLPAAARRVRLDAGGAGSARRARSEHDRQLPPAAQAPRPDPGGSARRPAHDGTCARASLPAGAAEQLRLREEILAHSWSVRATEAGRAAQAGRSRRAGRRGGRPRSAAVEDSLRSALATRVRLIGNERAGRIEIAYSSREELDRLVELIAGPRGRRSRRTRIHDRARSSSA